MLWTAVLWSALLWFVELHVGCTLSLYSPTPLQSYTQSRKGHHSSPKNTFTDFLLLRNISASFTWQAFTDVFSVTSYCHITLAWLRNAGSRICTKAKQGSPLSMVDITAFIHYICAKSAYASCSFCWPEVFSGCIKAINYRLWTQHTSDGSYTHPN